MNTQDQAKSYTVAELLAMPDDALNALAAEAMGWQIDSGELLDANGNSTGYWTGKWKPCTNRNQSGELLEFVVASHDACFSIHMESDKDFQVITIAAPDTESGFDKDMEIPGNDARAETVAFCAAMLAMEGKLNV